MPDHTGAPLLPNPPYDPETAPPLTDPVWNLYEALHATRQITLPCGLNVIVKHLPLANREPMLVQLVQLAQALLAVEAEGVELTMEMVRDGMPEVLAQLLTSGGAMIVVPFLRCLTEGIGEQEMLAQFTSQDMEVLWQAIWEDNRRPFETRLKESRAAGLWQPAELARARELMTILGGLQISSALSTAPGLTPDNPASPMTTPSRSVRRKNGTKKRTATAAPGSRSRRSPAAPTA
jgi:hypothetical protein